MSDSDLPDLPKIPSLEELGISPEELEQLEKEMAEAETGDPDAAAGGAAAAAAGTAGGRSPAGRNTAAAATPSTGSDRAGEIPPKARKEKEKRPSWKERRQQQKALKATGGSQAGQAKDAEERATATELGPAPLAGLRGVITLGFLVVAAWMLSSFRVVPSPAPATTPDTEFSSARAMIHMIEIARAAHPPGSPEHARVREYLADALVDLGLEPSTQVTTSVTGNRGFSRTATVRNLVARLPGTASSGAVLLTAHYDGLGISRGAGDDGVGVVAILETLRALRASPPLQNDVIVLFTDAEELGLLGSRAFVSQHPWMEDVSVVLSFEMRGGGGPAMMFETGSDNGWVVEALAASDPVPAANSLMGAVYERMPNDTDFTPFREAGKQGLNFAAMARAPVYHQQYDSPENLSEGTVQHQGLHALGVVKHLGNADLSDVTANDVAYLSLPIVGLVTFAPWWSYVLSAAILLLIIATGWMVRRGGAGIGGMVIGLAGSLAAGAVAAGFGVGLVRWIPGFHPEAGQLHGSLVHSEGWYVLALVAATYASSVALFGLLRRWVAIPALAFGALVVPALAAVAIGFVLPVGAMNLQWPVLAALIATGAIAGTGSAERLGSVRWVLLLVLAVPMLAVMIPLIEMLWLAMSLSMSAGVGILVAVLIALILPLADLTREPNGWWAPLAGLAVGAAFLGVGILMAGPDADRPAPSTLLYAYDREAGTALWATDPDSVAGGSTAAREWATERIGPVQTVASLGAFAVEPQFGGEAPLYGTTSAPPVEATLPIVQLLQDGAGPGRVRLSVRSEIGAELVAFQLAGAGGTLLAVNGQQLGTGFPPLYVEHWGTPEGDITLDFAVPDPNATLRFAVVESHLRPAELLDGDLWDRPAELAPNIRRQSDRVMIRTPITVDLGTGLVSVAGTPAANATARADSVTSVDANTTTDSVAAVSDDSAAADTLKTDSGSVPEQPVDTLPPDTVHGDTASGSTHPGSRRVDSQPGPHVGARLLATPRARPARRVVT